MPEEQQEKPQSDVLMGLIDKVAGKEESKHSSLPVATVIAGVVILIFAIMGFMLMRARRKAAKLASELRLKEEEQKQNLEDRKKADNAIERNRAHKKIHKVAAEILEIKTKLQDLAKANEGRRKALAEVTDWDDLVVVDKR